MEIFPLRNDSEAAFAAEDALNALENGGVILYPTDTLYGLGADATSHDAIEKIYKIKGRDKNKPLHAIVADMNMAAEYGEVNELAWKLADAFLPGALTLILRKREDVDVAMSDGRDEFAVRIPDSAFCLELVREFGRPYTTTSANVSGEQTARTVASIIAQLGQKAAIIDIAIDAGELPEKKASTIVNVSTGKMVIEREGAISADEILLKIRG